MPPKSDLNRQLEGLQPAVHVDPPQPEVVWEAAGGRGRAQAQAGCCTGSCSSGPTVPAVPAPVRVGRGSVHCRDL